ncbi:universal stress protein [Ekhidna sp.]|uniref:universal stress protein n=1 Tax=Ekhidna sp. TaxID=2608089 RepID=UPI003B50E946
MISSILIPTDFSPASWKATQVGIELSQLDGNTKLSFLHVYPIASKYLNKDIGVASQEMLERMKNRMNQLSHDLSDAQDRIENVVLSGNVDDEMMNFIKNNHFDLVIVGINSNGANNEIGSHTIRMIKESGIPVMIVPNKSGDGAITG